jgi:hypothetical protein
LGCMVGISLRFRRSPCVRPGGILIAHQPEDDAERQGRRSQGKDHGRLGLVDIEDDELANHRKERDQNYRTDLHDIPLMMQYH